MQQYDVLEAEEVSGELLASISSATKARSKSDRSLSVDDIIEFIGVGPFQWLAFVLAGSALMILSFETLTISLVSLSIEDLWNLNGIKYALIGSLTCATNIAGGLFFAVLSDYYGRVWPFALALLVVATGDLASAFAPSFAAFLVLRCYTAFGTLGVSNIARSMLVEFLPVRNRGKVLTLTGVLSSLGTCVGAGLGWWLIPSYPHWGWRYLIVASSIPIFMALVFRIVFFYQSPRYLLTRKKYSKAASLLRKIASYNHKDLSQLLSNEESLEAILAAEETRKEDRTLISTILQVIVILKPPLLRRTVCFLFVSVLSSCTLSGMVQFTPNLMEELGVNPYFVLFIAILGQIPGILLMSIVTEWPWFGRRNSLRMFTILGMTFAILLAFVQNDVSIPVFTMLLFFALFPVVTITSIFISESYPTEIRVQASTFFSLVTALFSIGSPYLYGYIIDLDISVWLLPVVMALQYFVLLAVSLFIKHDTYGKYLSDSSAQQSEM